MKVTLDLNRLLAVGEINQAEFDKLSRLSRAETGSLAFNVLVGLGIVAVAGAALALVQTPTAGIVIGLVLLAAGASLLVTQPSWLILANICILVAALMFGGGVLVQWKGDPLAFVVVSAIFAAAGILARSGLLVGLAVLVLGGSIGADAGYSHARYAVFIEEPALTILVFSVIAFVTFLASRRLPVDYERLALIASRTAVLVANMGFWVGSLWGDRLAWLHADPAPIYAHDRWIAPFLSATALTVVWAVALIAVGFWGARIDRRWVVNVATVFGAILFYTQWFEKLSATPLSVLVAGLITLAIAVALWKWNNRTSPMSGQPAAAT